MRYAVDVKLSKENIKKGLEKLGQINSGLKEDLAQKDNSIPEKIVDFEKTKINISAELDKLNLKSKIEEVNSRNE